MPDFYIIAVWWLLVVVSVACLTPGLVLLLFVEVRHSQRYWRLWQRAERRIGKLELEKGLDR